VKTGTNNVGLLDLAPDFSHRPHPGKEAKKYQIEEIRRWLETQGVKP
jgi:hypothetical protein